MSETRRTRRPRKKIAEMANNLLAGAQSEPARMTTNCKPQPFSAAEANEYLRGLPRVTIEDLERGTA